MKKIMGFFKEPLNQAALAGMLGTGVAVMQGQMTWQAAVPVVAGAIVAMVIPDNSVAKEDVEQLIADAIKAGGDLQKVVK